MGACPGALSVYARVPAEVRKSLVAPGRAFFSLKGKQRYRVDAADVRDDGSASFRVSFEVRECVTAEPLLAPWEEI